MILGKYIKKRRDAMYCVSTDFDMPKKSEIVIESDFRSDQSAFHIETVVAIEVMVVTDSTKTEGGGELLSSLPSDTGTEHHCKSLWSVEQCEVTSQIDKQRELLADGATHVTDVGFEEQGICGEATNTAKIVFSTQGDLPLFVNAVTNFRGDRDFSVVLFNSSANTATNPHLSID